MKEAIEEMLPPKTIYGNRGEATIRDVGRVDQYPELDERRWWISSWFKVELKDVYHRGIEVFLAIDHFELNEAKKTWRRARSDDYERCLKAFVVGRIPFDWIASVDWEGDEYYPGPHIYCRFIGTRRMPYEDRVLYYRDDDTDFLWLLHGYAPAKTPWRERLRNPWW